MGKLSTLRDYSLVAYLMVKGVAVHHNGDGSYRAEISPEDFAKLETDYRLHLKPVLSKITKIKRCISAARPHAVNLDSTPAPKGPNTIPAAQRGSVE